MQDWSPDLDRYGKPHYKAIADAIAQDVRDGRLHVSDRLPPQRATLRSGKDLPLVITLVADLADPDG